MAKKINKNLLSVGFAAEYDKVVAKDPYQRIQALRKKWQKALKVQEEAYAAYSQAQNNFENDFKTYMDVDIATLKTKASNINDHYALMTILDDGSNDTELTF